MGTRLKMQDITTVSLHYPNSVWAFTVLQGRTKTSLRQIIRVHSCSWHLQQVREESRLKMQEITTARVTTVVPRSHSDKELYKNLLVWEYAWLHYCSWNFQQVWRGLFTAGEGIGAQTSYWSCSESSLRQVRDDCISAVLVYLFKNDKTIHFIQISPSVFYHCVRHKVYKIKNNIHHMCASWLMMCRMTNVI